MKIRIMQQTFDEDPEFADIILKRVAAVGAKPVIAHAERYEFIQEDLRVAYRWRSLGYVIQVNRGSLMGKFGRRAQRAAYRMIKHNLVSVVASDAHSPYQRTPYLLDAYEELNAEYPRRVVDVLFQDNPERICNNQAILKRKAIPFESY